MGCAPKQPIKEQSAYITIKTPAMRYSDMGFIYKYDNRTKVQIYALGQPVLSLDIYGDNVCMSLLKCMSKKEFNQKVMNQNYPDDTIESILNGEVIFRGVNMTQNGNGFTQKITQNGLYEIEYVVANKNIFFNDKINKIIIKVDEQ
jgi:hypothetical protein